MGNIINQPGRCVACGLLLMAATVVVVLVVMVMVVGESGVTLSR